jgi:hypothetical protein
MSQPAPPHKATTREALRASYGFSRRTFSRMLKRVGIAHRRTVLTPKEVGQCFDFLVKEGLSGANNESAPTCAN